MKKIKFGTDGWRAIIAEDFTVDNLKRIAQATALWLKKNYTEPSAVVGFDCRFGGKLFSEVTGQVLAKNNIKVYLAENFVSTPMVSLSTRTLGVGCGIIITASHNPASYNGFKIKGNYGGPALPEMIEEVESLIPESYDEPLKDISALLKDGTVRYYDFETEYVNHAEAQFDMKAIRESGIRIGYDAMFGAGQNAVKRLLPDADLLQPSHVRYPLYRIFRPQSSLLLLK